MRTKFFATFLVVLAVLFGQVGGVLAAPVAQDTTLIEGTVTLITTETVEGVTTVLVTVEDEMGVSHTYRLSVEDADALDLVTVDETTGTVTADSSKINQPITIDTTVYDAVIVDEEVVDEDPFNPVAGMLADFFNVSNTEINDMHEDGFGFGLIAQALWIANGLEETNPTVTAELILQAKRDKDFSAFTLPDGSTPTNWGQFKNAATGKDKHNLGVIVSGHAGESVDDATTKDKGNGKDKKKDKDNNGKGKNP